MSDGTVQDSRNMVVYLLDPNNRDCYHQLKSPVQWGYLKVRDPNEMPDNHKDIIWNEYVMFLHQGNKKLSAKSEVTFEMKEATIKVNMNGEEIERPVSVAVLTGVRKCEEVPF